MPESDLTEFRIDSQRLERRIAQMRRNFAARPHEESFEEFAIGVLAHRMRTRPWDYLEFGPYWWPLKEALREAGHDFGPTTDALLANAFKAPTLAGIVVAAEEFKDDYRARFFVGHATYDLRGDGSTFTIFDPDMAGRAAAGRAGF
jgi:hypothetical protein